MLINYYRKTSNIPLLLINLFVQRILRINGNTPWMVHYTSQVIAPNKIKIAKNVERSFARSGGCYIQGLNGVTLEEGVLFAPGTKIISSNHGFKDRSKIVDSKPILIKKNSWIGANSTILPGVTVGENCIIGAGSVVTKSFTGNCIIAGNPAKIIKENYNA